MIIITKTVLKSTSYVVNDISIENKNIEQRINVNAKKLDNKDIFRVIFTVTCDAVKDNIAEELAKTIIIFESEYKTENSKEEKREIAKYIVNELYKTKIKKMVDDFYNESDLKTSSLNVDTFE